MPMNVVSKPALKAFWHRHPAAKGPLTNWYTMVCSASWTCFDDIRKTSNSADLVDKLVVFNANSYRVIVDVFFPGRQVYIKHVFTHAEYDKWTKQHR